MLNVSERGLRHLASLARCRFTGSAASSALILTRCSTPPAASQRGRHDRAADDAPRGPQAPRDVDVPTEASALGIGRSTLYEAIRSACSPVKTIEVRRRIVVLTADLLSVLEGGSDAPAA